MKRLVKRVAGAGVLLAVLAVVVFALYVAGGWQAVWAVGSSIGLGVGACLVVAGLWRACEVGADWLFGP